MIKRVMLLVTVAAVMAMSMALPALAQSDNAQGSQCTGIEQRASGDATALNNAVASGDTNAIQNTYDNAVKTLQDASAAGCTGGDVGQLSFTTTTVANAYGYPPPAEM